MSPATMADPKKPKKPAAKRGTNVGVQTPDDLLAALDAYIADQEVAPERPAVYRRALERFLQEKGYWKPGAQE